VRIARGHLAYAEVTASEMRELAAADEETQATVIEASLARRPRRRGAAATARIVS
jgi:hypothetical protein